MNFATATLVGLQRKHIYAGTVPEPVVRQRRAKNRAARRGNTAALRRQARLNRQALCATRERLDPLGLHFDPWADR